MDDKRKLMEEKARILNEAARAYYQEDREIMSNLEYDRLYDELEALERETGIVLSSSPTAKVGYQVLSSLPKEPHESPMLSLDKTKDVEELKEWLGAREGLLSWKLDGLTIVLTYMDGKLEKAVTRGDGAVGEVITGNARVFDNVPLAIPFKGKTVVRGEAVIGYEDFLKINETADEGDPIYKNPRNLCSGTVRQLNTRIAAERHVKFFAFALTQGGEEEKYRQDQFKWMRSQGFDTVEYKMVRKETLEEAVADFEKRIESFPLPSDGLVLIFDDIEYGRSLGATSKFPRDSIAFKWKDETKTTHLTEMVWNTSRTGLINPVAVFEPVELEGTTVTRASVHNLSIVKELALGIGDEVVVYKANMIIPQIAENLTRSGTAEPPEKCPVCGSPAEIRNEKGIETVHCPNRRCPARRIKAFTHFVSRNAMNIEGLSQSTLEKFINRGIIKDFADIFRLERWKEEIVSMNGFGEKSYDNLTAAAEKARHTTPSRLLLSLGVPNIGGANARMIGEACGNNWEKMVNMTQEELEAIDGIGEIMAGSYVEFFKDEENRAQIDDLMSILDLEEGGKEKGRQSLAGMTFVITGKTERFENRDSLKAAVEKAGGKVSGSVSGKTDYLINNDITSGSSKNRKARELGVPVINEEEFIKLLQGEGKDA